MQLVNKGRKNFSTKAKYEREPLAGCFCSSGSSTAQASTQVTDAVCVCQCSKSGLRNGNASSGKSGTSRNGVKGSSDTPYTM